MNGELVLSAALAATGGRWLRSGGRTAPPDLTRSSSSFQYVGSFAAQLPPRGLLRRHSTVSSAEEWLLELRARGVTDLALVTDRPVGGRLPRHVRSAFTNSGGWLLLGTGGAAPAASSALPRSACPRPGTGCAPPSRRSGRSPSGPTR